MNPHGLANILGRFFLALIFLVSGYNKITNWDGALDFMASHNAPYGDILLPIAVGVEILGGLLLVLGFKAQWASLALVAFLIPTTYYFHDFWNYSRETADQMRQNQLVLFLKNVAIAGGLIIVAARGAGPGSMDETRERKPKV
jgi:putative oxidoreductase